MDPLVSILIPAYNAEKWLKQSLDSALSQSWQKKEVIVVDDGSRDATFAIAKGYQGKNVKVVRQDNAGACAARNSALELAQGDYLQWLDSDDILHPEKIAAQMARIKKEGNDRHLYSSAFGIFFYRCSRARFAPHSLWHDLTPLQWFLNKFNNDDSMFPAVWLVSRRLTEQAGRWNERLTLDDDGEYFGRVIAAAEAVPFVPEAKSYYRQVNSNSISKTINHKACLSLLQSYKLCIGYMLALEDSERTRGAALKYLQTNFIYFYPEEQEIVAELLDFAKALGGTLSAPTFSRKYQIITNTFGLKASKNIATVVRGVKQRVLKTNDLVLSYISSGR